MNLVACLNSVMLSAAKHLGSLSMTRGGKDNYGDSSPRQVGAQNDRCWQIGVRALVTTKSLFSTCQEISGHSGNIVGGKAESAGRGKKRPQAEKLYAAGKMPYPSFGSCSWDFAFYSGATRCRLDASKSL